MRLVRNIWFFCLAVIFTVALSNSAIGQVQVGVAASDTIENESNIKGPLEFRGFVKELSKKLKGVKIALEESPDGGHENLTEVYRTVTPGSGMFEFKLEVNKHYVLTVEKEGYTTKKVDFDTDVRLARPQHTKVPKFEFEVFLVKDLDGLPFIGAVAHVFYQIKSNTFNYQLDYTKEELEDEERERLEKERKQRESELAYQKKQALEEAAKLLLDKENATAQQLIEAAITVGDGNKDKTVKGFLEVFSEVDTLRNRKATAMYDQLLEERKKVTADGGKIDFKAIFASAKTVENEVESKAEEERQQQVSVLRKEKEAAAAIAKEAMIVQQQAAEELARERLATAVAEDETRKKKEEKDKRDEVYYAIFNANGDSETAINNLVKSYPKSDPYREEKAKAIYVEYEKTRLTGTTLSNMNFGDLFDAADVAEQKAIQKELAEDRAKGSSALEAFKKKVEEQKIKEQEETARKIQKGLKSASKDRASQIAVFENSLPKNDPYKAVKAEAMYEQYVEQQKVIQQIELGLKTAPSDKSSQQAVFYNSLPENTPDREGTAQRMYDNYVATKQTQGGTGSVSMDFGSMFMVADMATEEAKLTAKEKNALEKQEAQDQLEERRDQIRKEKHQLAVQAEKQVQEVHRAGIANAKTKREKGLAAAIEKGGGDRDNSVEAIMKALPETGDKELDRNKAEAVYDAYLKESHAIKQSGNLATKVNYASLFGAAEKAELENLQKQYEQKEAKRAEELAIYEERRTEKQITIAKTEQVKAQKEKERAEIVYEETLHKTEAMRQERLAQERKEQEQLAKELAMEQEKRRVLEKEREEGELAIVEKERLARINKEQEAAAALAKAEAEKKRKEQTEADKIAEQQLALLEKQKRDEQLALEKKLKEEENEAKRLALEKGKQEALAKKAEEKALADAENKRKAELLAAEKEEQERIKAEEKAIADAAAKKKADDLAAQKAEEAKAKAEEERLAEVARKKAEQAEQAKQANYDKLVSDGDLAVTKKDFRTAYRNYQDAKALYPDNKEVNNKYKEAESEVKRIEKAEGEQLALDTRYNDLMQNAEKDLSDNNYDAAKTKFQKASELKPTEREPKQKIRNIDRTLDQIAADKKLAADNERKYILRMQDAAKALESKKLDEAKTLYQQANRMKPDEEEPLAKLEEIQGMEEVELLAQAEDQRRKDEAQKEFLKKQQEERLLEEEAAAKTAKILAERLKAQEEVDALKNQVPKTKDQIEQERINKYEKLQTELKKIDLNDDERRAAFLSQLAQIYPEGLTEESVDGKNFVLLRHVINVDNVVTIYEKKTWDWGGIFYFKNTDIAITEAIYKLEIGKY